VRVSDVSSLSEASLCYSSMGWFTRAGREQVFHTLYKQTKRQRGHGDFYGFVLVAEGAADVMVEHGVNPWDVAATKAIVEEAGGTFTDWNGNPTIHAPDMLATNGKLHADVLAILASGAA
jgi:histidinol-phosphatase